MNAKPNPDTRQPHRPLVMSLTVICFLFGGLVAMQWRSVESAHAKEMKAAMGDSAREARFFAIREELNLQKDAKKEAEDKWKSLQNSVKKDFIPRKVALQLTKDAADLRLVAGLTNVTGPGVVVTLNDNPQAAAAGGGAFLPGIVHDFDLQQVVHELLSAKAEAIAINGVRITGYTPIRCVGPTIYVNFKPCAAPFVVTAIGEPKTQISALNYPGGILENLRQQTLIVKVASAKKLNLPAMEGIPSIKQAKSVESR